MSRTPFSSRRPQRGGTFRPQLEALDERLAPGGLLAASPAAADLALAWLQAGQQRAATPTTNLVVDFATRSTVVGSSTLIRTDQGVSIHLQASGLQPGVYTFWWEVINPGHTFETRTAGFAAGHVVGEGGHVNIGAQLRVGEPLTGAPLSRESLLDAQTATVGMVVRYHGPAEPGRIHDQTHLFEPGLNTDADPDTGNFLISIHPPNVL